MQRAEQPLTQVPLVARYRANQRPPATAMLRGRARDQLLLQPGHSHHAASAKPARALELYTRIENTQNKTGADTRGARRGRLAFALGAGEHRLSTHEGAGSLDAEGFR